MKFVAAIAWLAMFPTMLIGQETVTLKVQSQVDMDDSVMFTLESGQQVTIFKSDILEQSGPQAVGGDNPESVIKAKCADEWGSDFKMQKYCREQQEDGLAQLEGRTMVSDDRAAIRADCADDWPDDYKMRNYCEERQLEALDELNR